MLITIKCYVVTLFGTQACQNIIISKSPDFAFLMYHHDMSYFEYLV